MSIVDARFVELDNGKKILQLQRSLWGGEGSEWFTPKTVKEFDLSQRELDEMRDVIG